MFFLFGVRTKSQALGQFERPCVKCARPTMHAAIEAKRRFTLFFIPVIPLGTNYATRCGVCGLALKSTAEIKNQLTASKVMAGRA